MSTAVANTRNTAVATGGNPWEEASAGAGGFVGKFVKFSGKTGEYTAGQEEDELEYGTQIIVDFNLITRGYKCWVDEEMVDEFSQTIASGEPLPGVSSLTDHGPYEKHADGTEDGWQETHGMPFIIDDESDDSAYLFQTSSGGGLRAMKKLYKAYGKAFQTKIDDDGNYMYPLIELDGDSYKHKEKKRGTIHNPVFTIVDWLTAAEVGARLSLLTDGESAGNDEDEDEAPARGRKARSEPEPEDEAPVRRGRKSKDEDEAPATGGRRAGGRKAVAEPEEEDEAPVRRGRRQKAADEAPEDDGGIEPEDHGEATEVEEDEAPTRRASGRRAKRFS